MSNYNTDLKTNNTNLQNILDTINNLPEVGGGSGGSNITFGTLNVEDMGMYEPGMNEYILSNDNLQTSTRHGILLYTNSTRSDILAFIRESLTDSFIVYRGYGHYYTFSVNQTIINENSITVFGEADNSEPLLFVAF